MSINKLVTVRLLIRTLLCGYLFLSGVVMAQPISSVDLAAFPETDGLLQRVYGSVGDGSYGVPVAGGFDLNGDGHSDYAFSAMLADVPVMGSFPPSTVNQAGQVFLIFGDGTIGGAIDTGVDHPRVLPIHGDQASQHSGSEIWMADVTGDGLGDLLICRQDYSKTYSQSGGSGEGALTIIPGQASLLSVAQNPNTVINLGAANAGLNITTIIGENAGDRFCMWVRNGDITGDGVDDIAVSADQYSAHGQTHSGAAYVIRGGSHLVNGGTIDLGSFDQHSVLFENIIKVLPPADPSAQIEVNGANLQSPVARNNSDHFHFGATLTVGNLDNGTAADLIIAAAFNRAGGVLSPSGSFVGHGSGGSPQGTVYIAWEDNFSGNWAPQEPHYAIPSFSVTQGSGSVAVIDGGAKNSSFGEEVLGGLDYNGDDQPDLFVGDLVAGGLNGVTASRSFAGSGHILYSAALLRNTVFDYDSPPVANTTANFLGPITGAIAADTGLHGDFNNDGVDDIATSSPHDETLGRRSNGTLHVLLGQKNQQWPAVADFNLASFPSPATWPIINIYGANGTVGADKGDTLAYSAAAGDIDNDGYTDMIINEMVGNGTTPASQDVGNLLIISGKRLSETLAPEPESDESLCFPVIKNGKSIALVCL